MGFGEAFINILLFTQWILQYPIVYDIDLDRLIANPHRHSRFKMSRWYIGNGFITLVWLFSIIHLFILMKKYSRGSGMDFKEEVLVYVFTIAITTQAVLTWETISRDPSWFAYVEGQILKAYDVRYRGWPNAQRLSDIYEIASYGLLGGFLFFPLVAVILPLIRSYDPINQLFLLFVPFQQLDSRLRMVIVVVAYLLSCTFGAISCLNMVLLTASHLFITTKLAERNLQISKQFLSHSPSLRYSKGDKMSQIVINILNLTIIELRNLRKVFQKRRAFYVQIKLITTAINVNLDVYVPYMMGVALVICIFSNYGIIAFHDRLPRIMIIGLIGITVFISALALNLILYASYPKTKSELFVAFWKRINIGKMERKQVKALVPVFFGMGQYYSIKTNTALDVMDTILECTVNALMA